MDGFTDVTVGHRKIVMLAGVATIIPKEVVMQTDKMYEGDNGRGTEAEIESTPVEIRKVELVENLPNAILILLNVAQSHLIMDRMCTREPRAPIYQQAAQDVSDALHILKGDYEGDYEGDYDG